MSPTPPGYCSNALSFPTKHLLFGKDYIGMALTSGQTFVHVTAAGRPEDTDYFYRVRIGQHNLHNTYIHKLTVLLALLMSSVFYKEKMMYHTYIQPALAYYVFPFRSYLTFTLSLVRIGDRYPASEIFLTSAAKCRRVKAAEEKLSCHHAIVKAPTFVNNR